MSLSPENQALVERTLKEDDRARLTWCHASERDLNKVLEVARLEGSAQISAVSRLRRLLELRGPDDWSTTTPTAPLAPYGQHSDPAGALVNFQSDLLDVLKALELVAGGGR